MKRLLFCVLLFLFMLCANGDVVKAANTTPSRYNRSDWDYYFDYTRVHIPSGDSYKSAYCLDSADQIYGYFTDDTHNFIIIYNAVLMDKTHSLFWYVDDVYHSDAWFSIYVEFEYSDLVRVDNLRTNIIIFSSEDAMKYYIANGKVRDASDIAISPEDYTSAVDPGFSNYNDVINSANSVLDNTVPMPASFKVLYSGVGALAKHVLTWTTADASKDYRVELMAAYQFQSSKSWAFNKDYNKSCFTFIDYNDNYKSKQGTLSFNLSTSNSDNSIIAKALQDVAKKFGSKESMAGLTANDASNSIKAYYIRNVYYDSSDSKYHYSKWIRCAIGGMYQADKVSAVDEEGAVTDSEEYPLDSDGNPTVSGDGGTISTGVGFFDFIISAVGGIGNFFTTLGDMTTSLVSGVGQIPQMIAALLQPLPPIVWQIVALGFAGVVICRFVGR